MTAPRPAGEIRADVEIDRQGRGPHKCGCGATRPVDDSQQSTEEGDHAEP